MADAVKSLPLFAALDQHRLEQLELNSEILDYRAGEVILDARGAAQSCIVLIDGHWVARHATPDGRDRTAEAKAPGSWAGGLGLIGAAAPVTITAKTDCTVLAVPLDEMQALAADNATVARAVLSGMKSLSALLTRAPKPAKDST